MSDFKITGPGWYRQRDGEKVEVVGRTASGQWLGEVARFYSRRWSDDGRAIGCGPGINLAEDLIAPWTEPKKGTVWVNVYEGHCHVHTTRADADEGAGKSRIACVSVNWTKGEGL